MIPWNPIHRYAGMTSLFDSVDEQQPPRVTLARWDDTRSRACRSARRSGSSTFAPRPLHGRRRVDAIGFASPIRPSADELRHDLAASTSRRPVGRPSRSGEKVPFYKREISFGRKKAEKASRRRKSPSSSSRGPSCRSRTRSRARLDFPIEEEIEPIKTDTARSSGEIEAEIAEPPAKVPFYKRELSFRRAARPRQRRRPGPTRPRRSRRSSSSRSRSTPSRMRISVTPWKRPSRRGDRLPACRCRSRARRRCRHRRRGGRARRRDRVRADSGGAVGDCRL